MTMKKKFYDWLATQPKEFILDFENNSLLGNGEFSVADLIALDLKYNPEGNDNDGSNRE